MESSLLKLHIESASTLYTDRTGNSSPSMAGHVWLEIVRADGSTKQAGFAPIDHKSGLSSVQGKVYDDDGHAYAGSPYFSATYRITESQVNALDRFINSPEEHGFDRAHYHAVTNSCVDFVWKGLQQIGMNPEKFEGYIYPTHNVDTFSKLKNPLIPGGGLEGIEKRGEEPRGLEDHPQPAPTDWWSEASNPLLFPHDAPRFSAAEAPAGQILVGPLGMSEYSSNVSAPSGNDGYGSSYWGGFYDFSYFNFGSLNDGTDYQTH
ncbi:hypothetical protein [Herbaspirillum seropedicae]|uniref:hypothetical protein n=1 Tax=Herbaspirillum seropedicae TaxID=964 RepID=UPI003FCDEF62